MKIQRLSVLPAGIGQGILSIGTRDAFLSSFRLCDFCWWLPRLFHVEAQLRSRQERPVNGKLALWGFIYRLHALLIHRLFLSNFAIDWSLSEMESHGPLPPDISRGPTLRTISVVTFAFVMLSGSLRMVTRGFIVRQFGWDDYTMVLALVGLMLYSTFGQVWDLSSIRPCWSSLQLSIFSKSKLAEAAMCSTWLCHKSSRLKNTRI